VDAEERSTLSLDVIRLDPAILPIRSAAAANPDGRIFENYFVTCPRISPPGLAAVWTLT
jgi:hypothetical protein